MPRRFIPVSILRWKRKFGAATLRDGGFQLRQLFTAMNHGSEVVLQQALFFAGNETGEDQDRFAHAGLAEGDAFFRAGDAKPVGAGGFQR